MTTTRKRKFMAYFDPGEWAYLEQYHQAHGSTLTEIVRRAVREYSDRHPVEKEKSNESQQAEL